MDEGIGQPVICSRWGEWRIGAPTAYEMNDFIPIENECERVVILTEALRFIENKEIQDYLNWITQGWIDDTKTKFIHEQYTSYLIDQMKYSLLNHARQSIQWHNVRDTSNHRTITLIQQKIERGSKLVVYLNQNFGNLVMALELED